MIYSFFPFFRCVSWTVEREGKTLPSPSLMLVWKRPSALAALMRRCFLREEGNMCGAKLTWSWSGEKLEYKFWCTFYEVIALIISAEWSIFLFYVRFFVYLMCSSCLKEKSIKTCLKKVKFIYSRHFEKIHRYIERYIYFFHCTVDSCEQVRFNKYILNLKNWNVLYFILFYFFTCNTLNHPEKPLSSIMAN